MARLGRVKVFSVDLSRTAQRAFGVLNKAEGFTGRAQTRMAQQMREAIREALDNVIVDRDFPVRTGKSQLGAIPRAFGTSFNTLRGHILASANIKVLNEGGEITPTQGDWLAIPIYDALRLDGTPKLPGPRSWQNIKKTFVFKSPKTKQRYIVYKLIEEEKNSPLVFLYILLDVVNVEGRNFLDKAWREETGRLGSVFGNIMMQELSRIDLLKPMRVTYKGRKV